MKIHQKHSIWSNQVYKFQGHFWNYRNFAVSYFISLFVWKKAGLGEQVIGGFVCVDQAECVQSR